MSTPLWSKNAPPCPFEARHDREAVMAATAPDARSDPGDAYGRRHIASAASRCSIPWGFTADAEDEDNGADWQQVARSGPVWLKNLFLRF